MPRVNRVSKRKQDEEDAFDLATLTPRVDFNEDEDAPFKRAYVLPVGTKTVEVSLTPRGREIEDVITGKVIGEIIITLPKTRLNDQGRAVPIDTPYSISIPGRTDDNEAIRDRQSLREVNRALYFGQGNGTLYRLVAISDEQYNEEKKARKDKETQDAIRRARANRQNVPEPLSMNARGQLPGEVQAGEMAESALRSVGA